jgi:hypothetical protein
VESKEKDMVQHIVSELVVAVLCDCSVAEAHGETIYHSIRVWQDSGIVSRSKREIGGEHESSS